MNVYVDTNCVIYIVERDPMWLSTMIARFARFQAVNDQIVVSDVTRAECLVGPFTTGNAATEAEYRAFFSDPTILVVTLSAKTFERAALIRAKYRFELVDSLHLAAAVEQGCGLFLTNDAQLARCSDIAVELLS